MRFPHVVWYEANNSADPCQLQGRGSADLGKFSQSFLGNGLWTARFGFGLTDCSQEDGQREDGQSGATAA
jgi:hypothetical protein